MVYPESKIVKDKLELIWVYLSSKVTMISSFLSTFLVYKLLFFTYAMSLFDVVKKTNLFSLSIVPLTIWSKDSIRPSKIEVDPSYPIYNEVILLGSLLEHEKSENNDVKANK